MGQQRDQRRVREVGLLAEPDAGLLDGVGRGEQQREQVVVEAQAAVAPGDDQLLEQVADRLDRRHVNRPRGPLEAMHRPEHRGERLGPRRPVRVLLQRQEVAVERPDVLVELAQEGGHQPLDQAVPVHRRSVSCIRTSFQSPKDTRRLASSLVSLRAIGAILRGVGLTLGFPAPARPVGGGPMTDRTIPLPWPSGILSLAMLSRVE